MVRESLELQYELLFLSVIVAIAWANLAWLITSSSTLNMDQPLNKPLRVKGENQKGED